MPGKHSVILVLSDTLHHSDTLAQSVTFCVASLQHYWYFLVYNPSKNQDYIEQKV